MTTTNLTGQWTGTIVYGKEYRQFAGKELYFDLEIIQQAIEIVGTAIDVGGSGTNPDVANIFGTFYDNKINFIKQYESFHFYSDNEETKIDKSRKGPKIKYTGIYNDNDKIFKGEWVIKMTVYILWLFPIPFKNSGTWTMKRK